jgi:hypothetical protein
MHANTFISPPPLLYTLHAHGIYSDLAAVVSAALKEEEKEEEEGENGPKSRKPPRTSGA